MSVARRILRLLVCAAALGLFAWTLLMLMAAMLYYSAIPEMYDFYAAEAREEKLAKGQIWIAVQALACLLSGGLCAAAMWNAWKKRNQSGEKREYHGDETSDSKRY